MDLIRRISKIFDEQAEDAHRIVIITKSTSKDEIEKFEKDIKNKENKTNIPEKVQSNPQNDDD